MEHSLEYHCFDSNVEITLDGAGEGNRTPASGLGSRRSTIELHPHIWLARSKGFEPPADVVPETTALSS
jgi:hypothetical protein